MKSKKWVLCVLSIYAGVLIAIAALTIIVDPFYHYHAPLDGLDYSLENSDDIYFNDGMIRNFDYDTMVTGTSMTLNFKTEEIDEIFGVNSIRTSFLGEGFQVINDGVELALDVNPELKTVIRSIDSEWFISGPEWKGRDEYPDYLYDDNPFNDVKYIYNSRVLWDKTLPTLASLGKLEQMESTYEFGEGKEGKNQVLEVYQRQEKNIKVIVPAETRDFFSYLEQNMDQNVLKVVEEHPDVTFYFFLPPYSILWWDDLNQNGVDVLQRRIDLEQYAIERMLAYDNVRLFSFFNNFELICDLDNYVDITHYKGEVNSQILKWMKNGEYELTKENYMDYIQEITEFYITYDYDLIFE